MIAEIRTSIGDRPSEMFMDDREKLALIMQEVGPRDDGIEDVRRVADDRWIVRFPAADIDAEFDPARKRLTLSSPIGTPPEDARLHVYETLMIYSRLAQATGGVYMALEGPGGQAVQMIDLACATLSTEELAVVLHNLAERTVIWRGFVEGRDENAPPAAEPLYSMIKI
jgi:hypothetical protein